MCRRPWVTGVLSIPLALLALAPLSPKPVLEEGPSPHEWLQGLAGEWRAEGGGATASVPTESARTLGSYWIVASGTVPMGGNSIKYQRTLGYDSEAKQFIGTVFGFDCWDHVSHRWLTPGDRASLIEHNGLQPVGLLQGGAVLKQNTVFGAFPNADHDGSRRSQSHCTRAGNDQHCD